MASTPGRRIARILALLAGLPLYVIGCVWWIVIPPLLAMHADARTGLSTAATLQAAALLAALPLGIALLVAGSQGYRRARLAVSLLLPVPIVTLGLLATPGNLSPAMLLVFGLGAAVILVTLLRGWARSAAAPASPTPPGT